MCSVAFVTALGSCILSSVVESPAESRFELQEYCNFPVISHFLYCVRTAAPYLAEHARNTGSEHYPIQSRKDILCGFAYLIGFGLYCL
jgi:hypothetical protein